MKVKYLGHAAVKLEGKRTVYIDPFLTGNPSATEKVGDVGECNIIIVTHDHDDHLGDAFKIAKKTGATVVSQHEVAVKAEKKGLKAEGMNIGGPINTQGIRVWLTPAFHTSATGAPTGCVVEFEGRTVYFAGDTGLFSDMKLIGEMRKPDLAILPIGGRYTMDEEQAAAAAKLIGAPTVIPVHYNTFPVIKADPEKFKRLVGGTANVIVLKPGESYSLFKPSGG